MSRGRRSAPGRRGGVGRGGTTDDPDETDEEDSETSVSDLTTEADPSTFDQTFTDGDANLSILGGFDPVAGSKQVIPRIAFVLNHNLVYNPDRGRWEPQVKGEGIGTAEVSLGTGLPFTIPQGMTQPAVSFDLPAGQSAQTTQPTVTVTNV